MNQDFLRSSSSSIAQEIQKYRVLKSQGTFETMTSGQSDVSTTMFSPSNSRVRTEERRPSMNSMHSKPALRYISKAAHHTIQDKAQTNQIISEIANKTKAVVEKPKAINDTVVKTQSRPASVNKSAHKTPVKMETTPVKSNTRPLSTRSNISTAERTPRTNSSHSKVRAESARDQESPVKKLKQEVREWKDFGESMAKSYEDLSVKYKQFLKEKEQTNATIASLNVQLSNFKDIPLRNQTEGGCVSLESLEFRKSTEFSMKERIAELEEENQNYKKTIEFLKDENEVQKKALIEVKKHQEEAMYYKNLADTKFKECSTLAEEIICLRTDLDRSHSNFLKMLKMQSGYGKLVEDALKTKRSSSPKKADGYRPSIKKAVTWRDDVESPKPKILKIITQKVSEVGSKI